MEDLDMAKQKLPTHHELMYRDLPKSATKNILTLLRHRVRHLKNLEKKIVHNPVWDASLSFIFARRVEAEDILGLYELLSRKKR